MKRVIALLMGGALLGGASFAAAHNTGREARTVPQCERLPTPARQDCLRCVTRPVRSHYHPEYPAGVRCRPDNGFP